MDNKQEYGIGDRMVHTASAHKMSPEVELVLLLSTPTLREVEVERIRVLARGILDWNRVFGMLVLHRTSGIAWQNIVDHGMQRDVFRPVFALRELETMFKGVRIIAEEQMDHTVPLVEELEKAGIPCALLKGAAVARMGYRETGMRMFGDNDLLFDRAHLAEVGALLKQQGYLQGVYDWTTGAAKPAARRDVLLHPTTSHETFPYVKATPEARISRIHCVDVHFSVDLLTSNHNDDLVRDLLSRRIEIVLREDWRLWTLSQEDMFIFVCIHFQREACNRREAESLKDLLLCKIIDIMALLESAEYPIDLGSMVERARALGFAEETYFALSYLDGLYPGRVPGEVLAALRPDSVEYLDQLTFNAEPFHTWAEPMTTRFFNPLRLLELGGE